MMTFNDVRLRYVVFVHCERHKCMRLSVTVILSRVFLHYNEGKMEEFIGCTAFQILYEYFKQISVEKKSHLYCELLEI